MKVANCIIAILLYSLLHPLHALAEPTVLFLYDGENKHHQAYVEESSELIHRALPSVAVLRRPLEDTGAEAESLPGNVLIVSVGAAAASTAANYHLATINTLITQRTFESLQGVYQSPHSAVFLEQSIERQLQLIKSALPEHDNLTVLMAEDDSALYSRLELAARRVGLHLQRVTVSAGGDVAQLFAKNRLAENTLLLLPDPRVVNRQTIKPLVLGSYRSGTPLVGYSEALVKAGALMAVHSSLPGLESEMMKSVTNYFSTKVLMAPRHAMDFEISVNYQLARALKISLPSEEVLKKRLQEQLR